MSYKTADIKIVSGLEPQKRHDIQEKCTRGTTPLRSVASKVLPNAIWEHSSNHAHQFAIAFIKELTIEPILHTKLCIHLNRKESFRLLVNSNTQLSDLEKQTLATTIKQIHSGLTSKLNYREDLEHAALPIANRFFSLPEAKRVAMGLFVEQLRGFVFNTPGLLHLRPITQHSSKLLTDILKNEIPEENYCKRKSCSGARGIVEGFLKSELMGDLPS